MEAIQLKQLNVNPKEYYNNILSGRMEVLEKDEEIASNIWNEVCKKFQKLSPFSIIIYHEYNAGTVYMECDTYDGIEYFYLPSSTCSALLFLVSCIATDSNNLKGALSLETCKNFLTKLILNFAD